jgi:hypothetical protein
MSKEDYVLTDLGNLGHVKNYMKMELTQIYDTTEKSDGDSWTGLLASKDKSLIQVPDKNSRKEKI